MRSHEALIHRSVGFLLRISFLLLIAMWGIATSVAFADSYYDKGRAYTTIIDHVGTPTETAVLSAGALFGPFMNGTGGNGKEQIRLWTRLENVRAYYNRLWGGSYHRVADVYAVRADHRFYTPESRRGSLSLFPEKSMPAVQNKSVPPILDQVIDFLNSYPGYPAGSTLKALFNAFQVDRVDQYSLTGQALYDWTVSLRSANGLSKVITDLPPDVDYTAADAWASDLANMNQPSSTGATFLYQILTQVNTGYNFCLWPQGTIAYLVEEVLGPTVTPHVYWSGAVGIGHFVNSNAAYGRPPCP